MSRKKILFYISLVVLSVLLWTAAYALIIDTTKRSAGLLLNDWGQTTSNHIESSIFTQAKELDQIQNEFPAREVHSLLQAQGYVSGLGERISNRTLAVVDQKGGIYDGAGNVIGTLPNLSLLQSVNTTGYALTHVFVNRLDNMYIAMIIPMDANPAFYLAMLEDAAAYTNRLSTEIAIPSKFSGIYDEWGNVVSSSDTEQRPRQVVDSFQKAYLDYSRDPENNIIAADLTGTRYNVFIPLDEPAGWFVNAYVSISDIVPMYGQLQNVMLVCSVVWFLLAAIIIVMDVRNERIKKYEMLRASQYDRLTGLRNSTGMQEMMEKFFEKTPPGEYAMVCMDVVAFHRFNTMFGYTSGDTLLKVIGRVILENYDCGVRINSDVFALAVPYSVGVAEELNDLLHEAIREELGEQFVQMVVFKFGIYPVLDTDHTFREIYDGALLALKEAKRLPKAREVTYTEEMQRRADMQKIIEMNMLHALSREEFLVYIQPKSVLASGRCIGGEALVRWQSEELGFIGPMDFIPLFEKNGFIVELDFYMLTCVLEMLENEFKKGKEMVTISVNQSRTTLTFPNYIDRLENLLSKYTVPTQYLEIEITESVVESNYEQVLELMGKMKEMGLSVAMDDFGSGYSSLNALRELPVDILKIDQDFLEGSNTSDRGKQIIVSVIHMAKAIGMKVICEGVETERQYDFLKVAGCDYIQGYYYAKPMPYEEFEKKYL